jgi:hypothetical protein
LQLPIQARNAAVSPYGGPATASPKRAVDARAHAARSSGPRRALCALAQGQWVELHHYKSSMAFFAVLQKQGQVYISLPDLGRANYNRSTPWGFAKKLHAAG